MSKKRSPLAALALTALVVLISACGSTAPAGSGSGITAAAHQKALKFAECMRNNGVSAFPDPTRVGRSPSMR